MKVVDAKVTANWEETKDGVTSQKTRSETIKVEQYDTLAEAVSKHGETKVLDLFNTQFMTNSRNEVRNSWYPEKVGTKSLQIEAMNRIMNSDSLLSEFKAKMGDVPAQSAFVQGIVDGIKKEREVASASND